MKFNRSIIEMRNVHHIHKELSFLIDPLWLQNGEFVLEKRTPTDVVFLCLFGIFLVIWVTARGRIKMLATTRFPTSSFRRFCYRIAFHWETFIGSSTATMTAAVFVAAGMCSTWKAQCVPAATWLTWNICVFYRLGWLLAIPVKCIGCACRNAAIIPDCEHSPPSK